MWPVSSFDVETVQLGSISYVGRDTVSVGVEGEKVNTCNCKSHLFQVCDICQQVNGTEKDVVTKPSNPKDLIGSTKVPFHFWPETATIVGAMACMYGNLQYGRTNWRAAGVKTSIYYDACRRHLNAWFDEGEDNDPDSGLPHLAHALACIAIIIDAQAAGKLTDDRMIRGGYRKLITEMTPHVTRLAEKFKDKNPRHYSIKDNDGLEKESNS